MPIVRRPWGVVDDSRYQRMGMVGDPCTYCGVVSDTMDHVPSLSAFRVASEQDRDSGTWRMWPACTDCNSRLGNIAMTSIPDRRGYVRDSLRRKHKKLLRMPNWDEDELSELSPEFAAEISRAQAYRDWIKMRMAWRRFR